MATSKKVQEVAKELNVTSKEIIEKLAEVGIEVKSYSSSLEEEHLGIIMDIFSQTYGIDFSEAQKEMAKKAAEKEKEEPEENAPEKKEEPK